MWSLICLDSYGLVVIEIYPPACYNVQNGERSRDMKPKIKPGFDPESIQSDLIETVCSKYTNGVSVRSLAKEMELSPMKVRKILITGGCYATDMSTEIDALYKDGKNVPEIAELLSMTTANVNSYLPYERIIYNMDERSVEADRQQRYRDRKKNGVELENKDIPKVERVRNKTMIIVIGKKLRKMIPSGVLDESSDPLAREKSYTYGGYEKGEFVFHELKDPDKSIWCAEATTAGRGKNKKVGVVLMSANCGFCVMSALPVAPIIHTEEEMKDMDWAEHREAEKRNREDLKEYRNVLEQMFLTAIRDGLRAFSLPEDRVLDYTDTVARIELVKGRISMPATRLEELIEQKLKWSAGDDPVERFNVRGNWTTRKFGNGDYRPVDIHTCDMLGLSDEEYKKWQEDFLAPMREKMTGSN